MVEKQYRVIDDTGLHARHAALIAKAAAAFQSDIRIQYQDNQANLKSIMGVLSLGLPNGADFKISVSGTDEQEALQEMDNIITKEGLAV
ncbi:HPr family phosphocarrier protein [Bacillus benzoevorans]|uniref:Phosphocarrier protein n=1 Tax=Bacillus benzoevorans TaxID=1456 RepID=A0A7X0HU88_9BACI|nr:HPr family phosphocarrier protein [Bacillus benzoevorans]MBB6446964.1 phosphocarrier protein [Bacillus benzoevorans]